MIADWLIILIAMCVLWATWGILNIIGAGFDMWWQHRRDQPGTEGPGKPAEGERSSAR